MNKSDFIITVRASDTTGTLTSIEKTDRVVSHVLDMLKESIVKHGSLKIQGFGVFEVVDVTARETRSQGCEVQAGEGSAGGGEPWVTDLQDS